MTQDQQSVPSPFVIRVDTYENHLGQRLFERVVVSGEAPAGFARFIGVGQINIPNSPVGPVSHPFQFAIAADSVDRAFSLFESTAQSEGKAEFDKLRADIRRQMTAVQVAPAGALGLLDPSGNPIKKG